jgi:Sec7-like guanine-nucleotide exchange factor
MNTVLECERGGVIVCEFVLSLSLSQSMVAELTRIGEEMSCTSECLQILRDSDETPQKKDWRRARKLFKNKPKEAIKFLLEKELLNNTPEDVALYLFQNGMDKVALGDYLGEGKDFNIAVLQEFVRLHKFHGMDLVQALRYEIHRAQPTCMHNC